MLKGWKAIANYLSICVRTAERWHKERGMPVFKGPSRTVIAFEALINEWLYEYDKRSKELGDEEQGLT